MPAIERDTDDPNDAHANQSTSKHSPTDPTPLDDPLTIDVTPVPFLRPGTVSAHERRRIRGDGGENVYATSRPTGPIDDTPPAGRHVRPPATDATVAATAARPSTRPVGPPRRATTRRSRGATTARPRDSTTDRSRPFAHGSLTESMSGIGLGPATAARARAVGASCGRGVSRSVQTPAHGSVHVLH